MVLLLFDGHVRTEDQYWFAYSGDKYPRRRGPMLRTLVALTPEIRGFALRESCAWKLMGAVYNNVNLKRGARLGEARIYPSASQWCDEVVFFWRGQHGSAAMPEAFNCPAAPGGPCHYAMNPNCRPDSAPDMVLLFETTAGWNQHGGPELFTFDNHDPRGGCVVRNDGTIKFIHSEEELKQLRWK